MATTDETFDPNDLDSIDALLDEAELEASPDDLDGLDDEFPDKEVSAEAETVDSNAEKPMPEEDLLDSLDDSVADDEPEVVAVSEPIMEESARNEDVSNYGIYDVLFKRVDD